MMRQNREEIEKELQTISEGKQLNVVPLLVLVVRALLLIHDRLDEEPRG